MKKSSLGFTLAEVLITLAIIGVVAAMTIPTLVNKYQDRVNETRYKKAVSMLSQAVQLSMAEIDSPGNMKNTDLWNCKDKDDVQACYKDATKKLFKSIALDGEALIDKMAEVDYGETTNPWEDVDYAFTTGDGLTFGYASSDEGLRLILDTNVASKPNNISKDLYALQVGANGKVVDVTASLADGGSACGEQPICNDWRTCDPNNTYWDDVFSFNECVNNSNYSEAECNALSRDDDNDCGCLWQPDWGDAGQCHCQCY